MSNSFNEWQYDNGLGGHHHAEAMAASRRRQAERAADHAKSIARLSARSTAASATGATFSGAVSNSTSAASGRLFPKQVAIGLVAIFFLPLFGVGVFRIGITNLVDPGIVAGTALISTVIGIHMMRSQIAQVFRAVAFIAFWGLVLLFLGIALSNYYPESKPYLRAAGEKLVVSGHAALSSYSQLLKWCAGPALNKL